MHPKIIALNVLTIPVFADPDEVSVVYGRSARIYKNHMLRMSRIDISRFGRNLASSEKRVREQSLESVRGWMTCPSFEGK